jgi:hypothetical protein
MKMTKKYIFAVDRSYGKFQFASISRKTANLSTRNPFCTLYFPIVKANQVIKAEISTYFGRYKKMIGSTEFLGIIKMIGITGKT